MRAVLLTLALLTGAAQAQTVACGAEDKPVFLNLGLSGVVASWPCVINDGSGFRYEWNRVAGSWGEIPEARQLVAAIRTPDMKAAINKLLGGRGCDTSPAVQALCDEAIKMEPARSPNLPTLWQTRPASWGGVSVYRLTSAGPDLSAPVAVIGRVLCDCAAYSGTPRADNSRLCQTQPAGVSFCFPAP